jgi:hypothetical protein
MGIVGLSRRLAVALLLPVALAGCASLAGSPPRVITLTDSLSLVSGPHAPYRMEQALRAFDDQDADTAGPDDNGVKDLRHGLSQYADWRAQVSDERRELGTGFDSVVIALTGVASVARQSLTRSLSATASIMAGMHGTIDRNVYFDRALPGLLAAMDTQRLRVLTRITQNLGKPAEDYPMATAFADLSAYELSASLDRAIEEITAQASEQRQQAQRELATAVQACEVVDDSAIDLTDSLAGFVHDLATPSLATASDSLAARTQALQQVGRLVGISSDMLISASPDQIDTMIRRRLAAGIDGRCAAANYQSLIDQIRTQTGRTVP